MANFRQQMHTATPRNMRDNITLEISNADIYKDDDIERMPLAMAYVPWQQWKNVYDFNKALEVGTIFPELNLPFCGARGDRV